MHGVSKDAGTILPVAVLRDARNGALLRTRLIDDSNRGNVALVFDVLVDLHGRDGRGIDVAVAVGRDAFGRGKLRVANRRRRDVELHLAVLEGADADAALAARIVGVLARRVFGFGIGDVQHVVLVDEDAARPAELVPGAEELAVLVEERDAAVAPK